MAWVFRFLMVTGAAAVVVTSVASSRVYLTLGAHYSIMVTGVIAFAALVAMWLRSPATLQRCLRRLAPVGAFALASLLVACIVSTRMPSGLAGFLRVSMAPLGWSSAAVLGYVAGRSKTAPLVVAAGAAMISAAAGLLGFLGAMGSGASLVRLYVQWSARVGAWVPLPGESFRAVGLDIDPNTLGVIGVVALVAAFCIPGSRWLRVLAATGAGTVIVMSGSRTALVAAVATALVALLADRTEPASSIQHRVRELAPVPLGVVAAASLTGVLMASAGGSVSALQRIGMSAAAVGDSQLSGTSSVDMATNGRLTIWARALEAYAQHPLGAFVQPERLVGQSIHNEYIERLLHGGPFLLGVFIWFLGWLAVRLRPSSAPALGPALCAAYAVCAVALGPSLLPPFRGVAFYFVGWGRAQPE